jgi:hypothetical protein
MISNLQLLNPDFQYRFFDNQQVVSFIDKEFPQYRSVFDSFRFSIQRYDFFRYLAIYRLGGFYFDLDVMLASSLNSLLDSGCVFPFEGITLSHYLRETHQMDWEIGNFAFGATPEHPFLARVIENCVTAQKDPNWVKPMIRRFPPFLTDEYLVLNTTGPGLLSRSLAENRDLAKSITVLFPDDLYDENAWNQFGEFGIHLMEGSWRLKNRFLLRRLTQYWERWCLNRLLRDKTRFRTSTDMVLSSKAQKSVHSA